MPIAKTHTELSTGLPPDDEPRYADIIVGALQRDEAGRDKAENTLLRNSWAGMCARAIGYLSKDIQPTEPHTAADYWRFNIGQYVHDVVQKALTEALPNAQIEVKVDMRTTDKPLDSSGHIDIVVSAPDHVTAIELKSIGGFGYKKSIGARGDADGPRHSAIMQGALNAYALDADEMVIIYVATENLSPREIQKLGRGDIGRFYSEWTFRRNDYVPIAEKEIRRLGKIAEMVNADVLPPRSMPSIPPKARIIDPEAGRWDLEVDGNIVDSGSAWECGYCPFRTECINDGST